MKEKFMAMGIILLVAVVTMAPMTHASSVSETDTYYDFMSKFIPNGPSFAYLISFKPEKIVANVGAEKTLLFSIVKFNMSAHDDFYLRFILSKASWEPNVYYQKYGDAGFMEKLKSYNQWLNATWPLTENVYDLKSKPIHFTPEMTNYSEKLELSVFQKGKIGITVLARMANTSLWVPVGGYGNINITGGNPIYTMLPVLYPVGVTMILTIISMRIKKRKTK